MVGARMFALLAANYCCKCGVDRSKYNSEQVVWAAQVAAFRGWACDTIRCNYLGLVCILSYQSSLLEWKIWQKIYQSNALLINAHPAFVTPIS